MEQALTLTDARPGTSGVEWRYRAALLSMAAVDLGLSFLFLVLSAKPGVILLRLPEVGLILVGLNLWGATRLFAPIRRFLATGEGREAAAARAARLGALTTRWAVAVGLVFTFVSFLVTPFAVFSLEPTAEVLAILAARALAWSVLLPYVAIFCTQEALRHLRRHLAEAHGIHVRPGHVRLGRRLALVFVGGAIVPALSIAVTLTLVPEFSPITGQPRSVVVWTTLAGASVALGVAFWATERSTTAGFRSLLVGMRRIEAGRRGAQVPVETEDELGRLAHGFNALSTALAGAQAERDHSARQFHEAQKREALGRLAAGIAHDFNNILAIIVMYADTARMRLEADEANARRLDEVLTAAQRGTELTARILDFARDGEVAHASLDLRGNVEETLRLLGETLARGIDLRPALPDGPMPVHGDATALHQLVANLCINAVHAMEEGGTLRVALDGMLVDGGRSSALRDAFAETPIHFEERDGAHHAWLGLLMPGRHARIDIADDGSGMDGATLRRVFDPYFTTKPVGEGTGLGLAAVSGILARHDGAAHVETRPGVGTTFRLYLPLEES